MIKNQEKCLINLLTKDTNYVCYTLVYRVNFQEKYKVYNVILIVFKCNQNILPTVYKPQVSCVRQSGGYLSKVGGGEVKSKICISF
jgi:hypothetical protein